MRRAVGIGLRVAAVAFLPALVTTASAAPATRDPRVPPAVFAFAQQVARIRAASGRAPIETLYAAARELCDSLLLGDSADPRRLGPLEAMDDSALAATERVAEGLQMYNEDVGAAAATNARWFLALARRKGDPADVAFFKADLATDSTGWLPDYVEMVTDDSGCTRFGQGTIVRAYAAWNAYRDRYPSRYKRWVDEKLDDVEHQLTADDCPCGDRASVVREMRLFLRRFPRAGLAPAVRARLHGIEEGTIHLRENCRPG